nr:phage tail tube protein [uncultured Roseococcus sp.]
MAGATQVAGTAYVKLDGGQLALKGNLKIQPSDVNRAGVKGLDGIHGFKEGAEIPFIEVEVTDIPDVSLIALKRVKNSTVTAEVANGKVFVLSNAWSCPPFDLDGGEGQVTIKFEGLSCNEL